MNDLSVQSRSRADVQLTGHSGRLRRPKKRLDYRQSRYLAHSVVLEEAGGPRLMRLTMLTVTLVVAAFVLWSFLTPIKEVSSSFGQVVPDGSIKTIQHLEGGIIKSLNVEEGQKVNQGDLLLTLEPASFQSELQQMLARQSGLLLQMERLRAFAEDREPDFSGIEFEDDVKVDQIAILQQDRLSLESQRSVLEAQLSQRQEEISLLNRQEQEALDEIALLEDELAMRESLLTRGLDSRIRVLAAQREAITARSRLTSIRGERNKVREALLEVDQRLIELEDRVRKDALTELGTLGTELAQVRQSLSKLEDRVQRLEVRAPNEGIVNGLVLHTLGGVVAPGAPIMEIVPDAQDLYVEAKITTRDIGHLQIGQDVLVKVVTYDFSRYGGIDGKLVSISPTTFVENNEDPFYKGRVELSQTYVGDNPRFNHLTAGMTVQADITTGQKTLFEYLLKPIYTTLNQSFSER